MKARKIRNTEPEITAQPKPIVREIATDEPSEEGLSIDPEDMGRSFIRYATEQGNFEGSGQREDLALQGEAPSDGALEGAHSGDGTIWETTVDLALEGNGIDGINTAAAPSDVVDQEDNPDDVPRGVAEIDLTDTVIDEASLLDEEADVLGEVIEPDPVTEDSGTNKRRGNHDARSSGTRRG